MRTLSFIVFFLFSFLFKNWFKFELISQVLSGHNGLFDLTLALAFPRLYCPRNCLRESQARVIGTKYYSDVSFCIIVLTLGNNSNLLLNL